MDFSGCRARTRACFRFQAGDYRYSDSAAVDISYLELHLNNGREPSSPGAGGRRRGTRPAEWFRARRAEQRANSAGISDRTAAASMCYGTGLPDRATTLLPLFIRFPSSPRIIFPPPDSPDSVLVLHIYIFHLDSLSGNQGFHWYTYRDIRHGF